MKRLTIPLSLCAWLALTCTDAYPFYCGSKLVSEGDAAVEVLAKCGEPAWKERHEEKDKDSFNPRGNRTIYIRVEEWYYNFGPSDWLYILRFENGILVRIETKGYGFRKH